MTSIGQVASELVTAIESELVMAIDHVFLAVTAAVSTGPEEPPRGLDGREAVVPEIAGYAVSQLLYIRLW